MSTLTRDPRRMPPLTSTSGRWQWPDPVEVTAPPVSAGRAPRTGETSLAGQWPLSPPPGSWPPLPAGMAPPPEPQLPPEPPSARAFDREPLRAPPPPEAEPRPKAPHPALTPADARRRDPSPSRAAYRLNRLWLTPAFRYSVRLGLPMALLAALLGGWLAQQGNRAALSGWVAGIVETIHHQPMFMVQSMQVRSISPEVAQAVADALHVSFPVSSFDLDLHAMRALAEDFEAVEQAWLQVRPGGILEVRLQERVPAMVWRHAGGVDLIDASGHRIARLASRDARADLPLLAGEGAPQAAAEARLLWAAATPLHRRIRGLVRIGERRWDLVLDRDQRILLPEHGALGALERVLALDAAQDLLSRDLRAVDLRNPSRPVLRLSAEALAELIRNRSSLQGAVRP